MRILEQDKKKSEIAVQVQDLNDLWTLYNIITPGDEVEALTQRRVVIKEGSTGERKLMKLRLKVEDVAFHEFTNRLRVKGTILEGPDDFVSYGSYHTFNVEINQNLIIKKEKWMRQDLKRLKESSKFSTSFNILIIAIESGLVTIDLITNYSHNKITSLTKTIPGKRYEQSFRNKFIKDFFKEIQTVLDTNIDEKNIDLIVVCGPGTTKDKFIKYLKNNSEKDKYQNMVSIHASSGTESAINETLKSQELAKYKKKIKVLEETRKIETLISQLGQDADLVSIGMEEVAIAANRGAIKQLLIADTVIRGSSKSKKLEIEQIISQVEQTGGEVDILNSQHPAGDQLVNLGSIVAILRYKF